MDNRDELLRGMLHFIDESPTCYHVVENVKAILVDRGYSQLYEYEKWDLRQGGKYFTIRGDSSLAAFRVPAALSGGFLMAAAHTDSPSFKIRENAILERKGNLRLLSVEPYGSLNFASWMNRPLSFAGRVEWVTEEQKIQESLVNIDRDLLMIPDLAIHFNRTMNDGRALKANSDLRPIFSQGNGGRALKSLISEELGISEEQILSTELYLYPREKGTFTGAEGEFAVSPRLDDLACVYACLQGFLNAAESRCVPLLCLFNHEEVGSRTRQGADSTFLSDILERICLAMGIGKEAYLMMLAESFMISADNAHAVHPNYPEFSDEAEGPVINGGIVLKHNAKQAYATDAFSGAVFQKICQDAGIPVQKYSNRADIVGGSTLGNLSAAHISVPTADIGVAQLAMHSACEMAGCRDLCDLTAAMKEYYGKELKWQDGKIQIRP